MTYQTVSKPAPKETPVAEQRTAISISPVIAVTAFFVLANLTWSFFNHGMPDWDAAGHVLNGFTYRDLLKHPHLTGDWIYKFLSVNYLYPPGVYILNGCVKLVFGIQPWVDAIVKALYEALLCVSVYGISIRLLKDRLAAVMAVVVVNLYPESTFASNMLMLDFPTLSMVALSVWAIINWKESPSVKNTILLGLAIGCACMTKQLAGAFIVIPAGILFLQTIIERRFVNSAKLLGAALIPAAMALPWLIVTYPSLQKLAQYNTTSFGHIGTSLGFGSNLIQYLAGFPSIMTPVLLCAFLAAILVVGMKTHRALLLVCASSLGGVVMLSTLSWAYPLHRYALPAVLIAAIVTGAAFSYAWSNRSTIFLRVSYAVLACVGALQYLLFNYAPYPLPVPEVVTRAMPYVGISLQTYHDLFIPPNPERYDWGQLWVLAQIKNVDKELPVYLQIMPNARTFNVHTMEYAAKLVKSPVIATTMRQWSVTGDTMEFSPAKAMYYHWYLITTGDQGNTFQDGKSEKAFKDTIDYVRNSGKFRLIAMRSLPDHSICYLYRQK